MSTATNHAEPTAPSRAASGLGVFVGSFGGVGFGAMVGSVRCSARQEKKRGG